VDWCFFLAHAATHSNPKPDREYLLTCALLSAYFLFNCIPTTTVQQVNRSRRYAIRRTGKTRAFLAVAPACTTSHEAGPDMATPRHGLAGIAVAGSVFAMGRARKRGGEQTSPVV